MKNANKNWRNSKEYKEWKLAVISEGQCICCGATEDLHAHHIEHATYKPELRYDVDNGACLCTNCHMILHNKIAGGYRFKCDLKHLNRLFFLRDYFSDKCDTMPS